MPYARTVHSISSFSSSVRPPEETGASTPPRHQCQSDEWVSNSVWSSHQRRAALNAQPWEGAGEEGRRWDEEGGDMDLFFLFIFFKRSKSPMRGQVAFRRSVWLRPPRKLVQSRHPSQMRLAVNSTNELTPVANTHTHTHTHTQTDTHTYPDSLRQTVFSTSLIIAEIFIQTANHTPYRHPRRCARTHIHTHTHS